MACSNTAVCVDRPDDRSSGGGAGSSVSSWLRARLMNTPAGRLQRTPGYSSCEAVVVDPTDI